LGARSFSVAAPKLWNGLPVELRQATSLDCFKSRLKTYLFKKYFLFFIFYLCKALLIRIWKYALYKSANY